jgi:predicted AAA+ superfamily ATPase
MIERFFSNPDALLKKGKVLIIYGARRVGKTTLVKEWLKNTTLKSLFVSGDNVRVRAVLSSEDFDLINEFVAGYELVVIDEAQQVPGIGKGLKIMADENPELKIVATGSSSFDLSQQVGEPLTGRKRTIRLFPIAQKELILHLNRFELKEKLEEYLVFGSYPDVLLCEAKKEKMRVLTELVESYLLKDILSFERLRNPDQLFNLLKLLAFQVGNLVSLNELGSQLSMNVRTVRRYIDLLEKSFIIYHLSSYSSNLRKEIAKKNKYYFYDNGIRNAVILQMNALSDRNDLGALWENFVMTERIKKLHYEDVFYNRYFWRNYNGREIDLLEEKNGKLKAFEFKWKKTKAGIPNDFEKKYGNTSFEIIHPGNYLDFIL